MDDWELRYLRLRQLETAHLLRLKTKQPLKAFGPWASMAAERYIRPSFLDDLFWSYTSMFYKWFYRRAYKEIVVERVRHFGRVEIACMLGLLPNPLPYEFAADALRGLDRLITREGFVPPHFELTDRPYVSLPLLERLYLRLTRNEQPPSDELLTDQEGHTVSEGFFNQFLAVGRSIEDNASINAFVKTLLEPDISDCSWDDVEFIVSRGGTRPISPYESTDRLDKRIWPAVEGFYLYFSRLPEIRRLLDMTEEAPRLQSAIWHYHTSLCDLERLEPAIQACKLLLEQPEARESDENDGVSYDYWRYELLTSIDHFISERYVNGIWTGERPNPLP